MRLFGVPASMGFITVLSIVAIIALTVVGYVKFLGKRADRRSKGSTFFQFDHFYIEKILKVVYLFSAVCVAVTAIATPFGAAATTASVYYYFDFGAVAGAFFGGLLTDIVIFLVGQFLCRISFEFSLMFVRLVTDTRAIRTAVAGDPAAGAPSTAAAQAHPFAGGPQSPSQPPVAQAAPAWTCPQCGRAGNAGSFCGSCGARRP